MLVKRLFSVSFLLAVLAILVWLVYEILKPEILAVGSIMPELSYIGSKGKPRKLITEGFNNKIVILFDRNCEHCEYQLNQFNEHVNQFKNTNIYLLTTENRFFEIDGMSKWPALADSENFHWGVVDKNEFKSKFGMTVIPQFFFFDKNSKLHHKIRGEVRIEKVLKILKNLGGPERRVSGYN